MEEKVVIDLFVVPTEAREEFLAMTRKVQSFLKTLPDYVEGYLYEKQMGDSQYNIMTTAVWKNADAIERTRQAVAAEFQRQGINPPEMMQRLGVQTIRSLYNRAPY